MTARFSGRQWTELASRDLTSVLILTRVDADQVQLWFIPICVTILCQLQKMWSYQGLLYLKKALLVSAALQHAWRWACCPRRRALFARLSRGCQDHLGHQLSGTRRGKLRYEHLTTSHRRSLLSSTHRDRLSGCEEEKLKLRYLKLPAGNEDWKKVLYFTVDLGPPLPPGSDSSEKPIRSSVIITLYFSECLGAEKVRLFQPRFVNNACFHLRMSVLRRRG